MARRKKTLSLLVGLALGALLSFVIKRESPACSSPTFAPPPRDGAGPSGLLFVGVMTAAKYLDTRARAVYDTWGRHVPGRLVFFSSEHSTSTILPLVALIGVDDVYPPQKKSFTMLKYMHDHHLEEFEWFMRADDDVYVRTDKLERFLRGVDSSRTWFIGQTGRGNSEEFGLLSLENDENFCMGGPGMILSRETLRKLGPNIEECLANMYTTHEDVEVGRCVKSSAGVSCTWSYEMQVILYHNQSGDAAFSGDLKQKEVHRAITLHPVKKPEYMYRLHNYVKGLNIRENKQKCIELHRDIAISYSQVGDNLQYLPDVFQYELSPYLDDRYYGEGNILGKENSLMRFQPKRLEEVLDWEFISKSHFSYKDLNPKRRYGTSVKDGLNDAVREVMEIINQYSKQRGRVIDFKEVLYGYYRLDPIHGVDFILDLLMVYKKYRGRKMTVPVRRHAYIQQTFTGIEIREIIQRTPQVKMAADGPLLLQQMLSKFSENIPTIFSNGGMHAIQHQQRINFILPLSGRFATFQRFLQHFSEMCGAKEDVRLILVLYKHPDLQDDFDRTLNLLQSQPYDKLFISVKMVNETFARGRALQHGVDALRPNDLLFFIDVDIIFSRDFLFRVRRNAVAGKTVYFPIVFSMYNESHCRDASLFEPDDESGAWRSFGFGLAGMFKSDYGLIGGLNTTIHGWGFEDVNFYDKAVKSSLRIVRSVDVGLIHLWHPVVCDPSLDALQTKMCLGTKASTMGSLQFVQNAYVKQHWDQFGEHVVG